MGDSHSYGDDYGEPSGSLDAVQGFPISPSGPLGFRGHGVNAAAALKSPSPGPSMHTHHHEEEYAESVSSACYKTPEELRREMIERIKFAFVASGEQARTKDVMQTTLDESGWRADLKKTIREKIQEKGKMNVMQLFQEMHVSSKEAFPPQVPLVGYDIVRAFVEREVAGTRESSVVPEPSPRRIFTDSEDEPEAPKVEPEPVVEAKAVKEKKIPVKRVPPKKKRRRGRLTRKPKKPAKAKEVPVEEPEEDLEDDEPDDE